MILVGRPFVLTSSASAQLIQKSFFEPTARSFPICIGMEADLPSLDQLRNNAAECTRLAEAARTSQHKSLFIGMAEKIASFYVLTKRGCAYIAAHK